MAEENITQFTEREQTSHLIEELLAERTQVWNLYCGVAGVESYQSNKPMEEQVQEFCQMLVDYISLGHFGVYQRIIEGSERRKTIIEAAERIYPQIVQATEAVLKFNEKYQQALTPAIILNQLADDLSVLGDQLATRIELEDELISKMLA
ncbi:MAG: Rsd/AlgQ family anti-sigma factor [Methyloprofundus sp.]|nr:Rsd/AlgQ family anti-sigma factor [Methyloprofundus sp.]